MGTDHFGPLFSNKNTTYVYDSFGQLIRENNKLLDKTFIYEYNGIGNITSVKAYAFTTADTPSGSYTTTSLVYGSSIADRLTGYGVNSISYNSIGYPTAIGNKKYVWTKGKLTRIYDDVDENSSNSSEDIRFTYDAYGRRIAKVYIYDPGEDYSGDYMVSSTTTYDYDNSGRLIREYCTERYYESDNVTREIVYLYDESGVIGAMCSKNGAVPTSFYYHRNLQGDVTAIYNSSGTKVGEYAYDAWGNCTILSGVANDLVKNNPIRYRGYYFDNETGLYYLKARYYNPQWRRFISPDSTKYIDPEAPNGLNLYCYCNNDPINYVDNCGQFPIPIEIITTLLSGSLELADIIMNASLESLENAPEITMEVAKKIARQGGHALSARQIIRDQQSVLSATRNSIDDIAKISKTLGKVLLVADIAWSLGENILSGEESWLSDTIVDAGISLVIYGLSFVPCGFFVSLAVTVATFIFEEQIEQFKDDFYREWDAFWSLSPV